MIGVISLKFFIDRLINKVREKNSHICVGLDPHLDLFPNFLLAEAKEKTGSRNEALGQAVWKFNRQIIDSIKDVTAVVKPQIALYEKIGVQGLIALNKTVKYAHDNDLMVILDAKRNDIGSTAKAYVEAYLDNKYIDAITVNPYLGYDGIKPFLKYKNKGAFALVRTSNKSAVDIQDIMTANNQHLFQRVGTLVSEWGKKVRGEHGYSNLGAVVGATYPAELKELRRALPSVYFLIPGYGVQGGGINDIIGGFNKDNLGALVNSARGIIFAWNKGDDTTHYSETKFAEAARKEAIRMRDEINMELAKG
jgi:orotidine-5'-phosphate decarboxylase